MTALFKLIAAIFALIAASFVTKQVTGKHIHTHAYLWWSRIRDEVTAWANANRHLGILRVVMWLDRRASALARLFVKAETRQGARLVKEEEIDLEQALAQFPSLRTAPTADITSMVLT